MKNWFLQKNDSEQKIIAILIIFSLLILLYTFLYLPLKRNNAQLRGSIAYIQSEIAAMQSLAQQKSKFANANITKLSMDDSQIMSVIEEVAAQQQIASSNINIKSQGKNKISVTLNHVAFNVAMRWLDILQTQHHISISQLNVEAEKNGFTNITAIISH